MKKIKTALDVDGILANFYLAMCIKFNKPYEVIDRFGVPWIENNIKEIEGDLEFWDNIPNMNYKEAITFDFDYYITAVSEQHAKSRIDWLKKYEYPDKQVLFSFNKAKEMKNYGIDVLIDDKYENIKEVTDAGLIGIHYIPNYLEQMSHQKHSEDLTIRHLSDARLILEDIQELKYNPNVVTIEKAENFDKKQKLRFIKTGEIYDFGYIGQTGRIIAYNEGERNMQDSYAFRPATLEVI